MPLEGDHILKFLGNAVNERYNDELLDLIIERIDKLCFQECQVDRIACTLTPMCSRRFLLKLRIINGLGIDDLPKFCYSVHKGVVEREFRGKTVIYKPYDSYLYLIDFLDIYFHGDYRKLNKFISFKNWEEAFEILDRRISKGEKFNYLKIDNYIILKFEERTHIIFIDQNYVICNANREDIPSLELIKGICELNSKINFPEIDIKLIPSQFVELKMKLPNDVISKVKNEDDFENDAKTTRDEYFWEKFPEEIATLTDYCKEIHMEMNRNKDLVIKLYVGTEINYKDKVGHQDPLRYRDLKSILEFVNKIYNQFYVIWV
jgi:hypothetical protein